jgi:type IV pilus assembly protein PilB
MPADAAFEAQILQRGLITERELGEARAASQRRNAPLEESLVALGFLTEDQVGMLQAESQGLPYVFPHADEVPPELVARFPRKTLEEHQAVPLLMEEGRIVLASPAVLAPEARKHLGEACGADIVQALASRRNVQRVLKRLFPATGGEAPPPARDPGAVGLVYGHLARALSAKATELRFEPDPEAIRVRYRVDGRLEDRGSEPLALLFPLVSRLRTLFGNRLRSRPAGASGILRTRIGAEAYRLELTLLATRLGECALLKLAPDLAPAQEAPRRFLEAEVVGNTADQLPADQGLVLISSALPDAPRALSYALLKGGKLSGRTILTIESSSLELRPEFRQVEMAGIRLADALEAALAYEPEVVYVGHVLQWPGEIAATLMAATSRLVLVSTSDASAIDTVLRWIDCGAPAWLMSRVLGCLVSVSGTQDVSVIPATAEFRKALERRAPPDDLRRAAGL